MNVRELKDLLNSRAEEVVQHLLPAAKRKGGVMTVGSIDGEPGDSLSIVISGKNRGVWKDWAVGGKASDLIDLWRAVKGLSSMQETLKEIRRFLGVKDYDRDVKTAAPAPTSDEPEPEVEPVAGPALAYAVSRGISKKTLEKLKVGMTPDGGALAFRYETPQGSWARTKFLGTNRENGKKRIWIKGGGGPFLWGMWAVPEDAREIVICEGEFDALSWWEAGVPAVSVPDGAGSDKWVERCFNWLQEFESITIAMDSDEEGEKATERLVKRLGVETCKVVRLPQKDANDCLRSGDDLKKFVEQAQTETPENMVFCSELADKTWEAFGLGARKNRGMTILGFDPSEFNFRLRPREMTVYTGYNGSGKSTFLYQLVAWLTACKGETVFIGSYEEPCSELVGIIATQAAGLPFTTATGRDDSSKERFDRTMEVIGQRISMHETESTIDYREFFDLARYAVRRYGASHVFLDSLTKTNVDLEDNGICKKFMEDACEFFQTTGAHLHCVAHPRKPNSFQFNGKKQRASKFDVKGSGIITDLAYNVLSIYRPEAGEESSWDGELMCSKDKVGGGGALCAPLGLNFDDENYRFYRNVATSRTPYWEEETQDDNQPF